MKRILKNQYGYLLLDVLIALSIFAVAMLGLLAAYSQSLRASSLTSSTTTASQIASEKLESLKGIERLGKLKGDSAWTSACGTTYKTVNTVRYTIVTSIIANAQLPSVIQTNNQIIPVKVAVSWQGKTTTMMTYYYANLSAATPTPST